MMPLLLDTCAAIWLAEGQAISNSATAALNEAVEKGIPVYVSIISSWEIGVLAAKGRLPLSVAPLAWFDQLLNIPGVRLAELSPRILIASSYLPGKPPKDPMDRILLATARDNGHRIVTRDKRMLGYAGEGHAMALAC